MKYYKMKIDWFKMWLVLLIVDTILQLNVAQYKIIGKKSFRPFFRQDANDFALGASDLMRWTTSHFLKMKKISLNYNEPVANTEIKGYLIVIYFDACEAVSVVAREALGPSFQIIVHLHADTAGGQVVLFSCCCCIIFCGHVSTWLKSIPMQV